MNDVKLLETREGWKQFVDRESKHGAEVKRYPVTNWGDYRYIVTDHIKLQTGLQRLEVIDVTDMTDLLLVHQWPGVSSSVECDHAVVIWPDEGHVSTLDQSGTIRWVRLADLGIRVVPGSRADAQAIQDEQMSELQAHVDSGGHIQR